MVLPGTMDTPANRKAMPGADFSKWLKPAYVADLILSLMSAPRRSLEQVFLSTARTRERGCEAQLRNLLRQFEIKARIVFLLKEILLAARQRNMLLAL